MRSKSWKGNNKGKNERHTVETFRKGREAQRGREKEKKEEREREKKEDRVSK